MAAFPSHRPLEPARRQALQSRLSAAADATRSLEQQLAAGAGRPGGDPTGLLVPAARALLGVLHRYGGQELVVSLGSDRAWEVRVRRDTDGPSVVLVRAGVAPRPPSRSSGPPVPPPGPPARSRPGGAPDDEAVAVQLAALLRADRP